MFYRSKEMSKNWLRQPSHRGDVSVTTAIQPMGVIGGDWGNKHQGIEKGNLERNSTYTSPFGQCGKVS